MIQKVTKHPWINGVLVVLGCSTCTVSTKVQQMSGFIEKGRRSNQVNNEMWKSETHAINIVVFHHWIHSTGCSYSSLAHYSCWQQKIVVHTSLDLFHLDLTPADQFNLLHFRHDQVLSFSGKVLLRVKLSWCSPFLFMHMRACTHTHTHTTTSCAEFVVLI